MLDQLVTFAGQLGHWGYLVIFMGVALECQVLLGFIMPGESLVLAGGFFAEQGLLHPGILIVVISIAAILGDSIGYELGRHLGQGWLLKQGGRFGLRQEHLHRVDGFFVRHGGKAVFGSHFMHLLRSLMPFVAGARRMRYLKFLLFNALGCIIWATVFVSLGYLAGETWRAAAKWIGRASEIIGGALLLAIALGWLWRWLGRHEADVRHRWQALAEHPRILALHRRFAPQLEFLLDRISPRGYLGLHLTVGVLLLIGASWLFGGIAQDVVAGDPLTVIDKNVADWFHERRTPVLTTTMLVVSGLASAAWVTGVATVAALVLWWKRCWFRLLALVLVVPGGMVLAFLLKIAFHRQRPSFAESFLIFNGYSFPSGHTMAATLLYGVLAALTVIAIETWRWRVGAVLGAFAMVLLVGFSRVYLGAHYLSDVLGAAAAGLAWLTLSLTAVDTVRRSRDRQV
ncbi:MAG: bifunctional DedA family/phosphatase PAP2 family protein [Deltaproteobacteria bacterium]|nr:bifunctional DedA family/phosphatase PAP2 family protein [Deltaproteobacteria bacterium]